MLLPESRIGEVGQFLRIDRPVSQHAVPALPDIGSTHANRIQSGGGLILKEYVVRQMKLVGPPNGVEDVLGSGKPGGDTEVRTSHEAS